MKTKPEIEALMHGNHEARLREHLANLVKSAPGPDGCATPEQIRESLDRIKRMPVPHPFEFLLP